MPDYKLYGVNMDWCTLVSHYSAFAADVSSPVEIFRFSTLIIASINSLVASSHAASFSGVLLSMTSAGLETRVILYSSTVSSPINSWVRCFLMKTFRAAYL